MSGGGRGSGFVPKIIVVGGGSKMGSGQKIRGAGELEVGPATGRASEVGGGGGGGSKMGLDQKVRGAGELEVGPAPGRASGWKVPCSSATRANGTEGGGSPIFSGMRILLVGFAPRCRRELVKRITERGGSVLSSAEYELYTHICVEGESQNSDKRIVTKDWIKLCCDLNMRLEASNVMCKLDEEKFDAMKGKMRSLQNKSSARRVLYFEDRDMLLHELFVCEADTSTKISLVEYLEKVKELVIVHVTPGDGDHTTISTAPKVKKLVRELYVLIKSLHRAGFTLWGQFSIKNFAVDESRMRVIIKFTNLPKSTLKESQPEGVDLDLGQFVRMVKRDIFNKVFPPHDITVWLSMVVEKEFEELLPDSSLLMDLPICSETFSVWYDIFLDLKESKSDAYFKICKKLEAYNGWRVKVKDPEANALLAKTLGDVTYSYDDNIDGLLRLLRNSRQHLSRYRHSLYALIIGQNFPNLMVDFQKALYEQGCLE